MTPREEYLERCRSSPQFERIGVEPMWRPGEGDVEGFVHDEVVRQGHDPRVESDGVIRIRGMLIAWAYARTMPGPPRVKDVRQFAAFIEPEHNAAGYRKVDVRVGSYVAPRFERVPKLMAMLWKDIDRVRPMQGRTQPLVPGVAPTADDFYLGFEAIHPFRDGNGRTGKILHNALLGTLDEPVLIADYFGGGNP